MEKIRKIYLSSTEVSEVTGLPVQSVRRLAREGRIPSYKFAGKHMFRIEEVVDAIEKPAVKIVDSCDKSCTVEPAETGTN